MSWTQTDLDAIEQAIAMGATRVRYGDRDTTFRDLDEMKAVRNLIRASLGLDTPVRTYTYGSFSKGLT